MNNLVPQWLKGLIGYLYYLVSFTQKKGTVVLMYHSVCYDDAYLTVTPENFQKQMKWLTKRGWRVLSLSESIELEDSERAKTVVITFDDAFESIREHALPVLRDLQFPATIFVPTDYVGKVMSDRQGVTLPVMSWSELQQLANDPLFTIGSHTSTHPTLPDLSESEIRQECIDSHTALSKAGIDVQLLAYPKGRYNELVIQIVPEYYYAACSTIPDRMTGLSNQYALPRREVNRLTNFGKFLWLLTQ